MARKICEFEAQAIRVIEIFAMIEISQILGPQPMD